MIPGVVATNTAFAGAATMWTPLNMATVPQIYLDVQDSVVTDVGGFCSAISNLGVMGANGDFSQATAADRPAILTAELNGKRVLRFDGATHHIVGSSTAQKNLFRNISEAWAFIIYKKRSADGAGTNRVLISTTRGSGGGARFAAYAGTVTTSNTNKPTLGVRRLDADALAMLPAAAAINGSYTITLHSMSYSTQTGRMYTNGALSTQNTTLTSAGSTSDTESPDPVVIGRFSNNTTGNADVDIAAILLGNTALTTDDRQKLEGWAAHKYGLTANLPSDHPYKTAPPYA